MEEFKIGAWVSTAIAAVILLGIGFSAWIDHGLGAKPMKGIFRWVVSDLLVLVACGGTAAFLTFSAGSQREWLVSFFSTPFIYYTFQAVFVALGVLLVLGAATLASLCYRAIVAVTCDIREKKRQDRLQHLRDQEVINRMELQRLMEQKQLTSMREGEHHN